jgi:hypothetical protein
VACELPGARIDFVEGPSGGAGRRRRGVLGARHCDEQLPAWGSLGAVKVQMRTSLCSSG